MYADDLLRPWADAMLRGVPGARLFDAHTHVGENDPNGFTATIAELDASLVMDTGAPRSSPWPRPTGTPNRTGRVPRRPAPAAAASSRSPGSRPWSTRPTCLTRTRIRSRGVKLHPASDAFELADRRLAPVYERSDAHRLPVIVHARPELEGVGRVAL